jgi:DNA-binding transcriptional regulator YiaG
MSQSERLIRIRQMAETGEARRLREAANLSLRELAPDVLVDASTLARWETGECRPRGAAALRWERALRRLEQARAS